MKKLFIISAIAFSGLVYNTASAQIRVRLGLNLAPQRVVVQQEPVYNNDGDDYYYLPDVDAYFDVNNQCYVYFDGDNWISAAYLPGEYRDYDWRNARRYEVRAARPYMHADFYRSKYDGHQFNGWAHNTGGSQYNGGNRGEDHRFDRGHGDYGRVNQPNYGSGERYDRGRGGYAQHNGGYGQHPNNDGQGGYSQPAQPNGGNGQHPNNGGQGGYSQPAQPNGGNGQHGSNGGQGGYSQPAQPNGGNGQHNHGGQSDHGQSAQPNGGNGQQNNNHGGNGQPANQGGGHNRGNGGVDEHVAQNNPRGGLTAHRMARF